MQRHQGGQERVAQRGRVCPPGIHGPPAGGSGPATHRARMPYAAARKLASAPLLRAHRIETYAFMLSGLAFVLSFWSVSLIHAISFVRWPADLVHYFFYFGLAFCECLTFMAMDRPRDWFGFMLVSFLVTWALYIYDYRLVLRQREAIPADAAQQ